MSYLFLFINNNYIFLICLFSEKSAYRLWGSLSRVMRKPAFCICENNDADRLCTVTAQMVSAFFRHIDCTLPPLYKSEISSLKLCCVAVQSDLCRAWPEISKTGFLATRLIFNTDCFVHYCDDLITSHSRLRTSCIFASVFESMKRGAYCKYSISSGYKS